MILFKKKAGLVLLFSSINTLFSLQVGSESWLMYGSCAAISLFTILLKSTGHAMDVKIQTVHFQGMKKLIGLVRKKIGKIKHLPH